MKFVALMQRFFFVLFCWMPVHLISVTSFKLERSVGLYRSFGVLTGKYSIWLEH